MNVIRCITISTVHFHKGVVKHYRPYNFSRIENRLSVELLINLGKITFVINSLMAFHMK